jgi:hypothetical protein
VSTRLPTCHVAPEYLPSPPPSGTDCFRFFFTKGFGDVKSVSASVNTRGAVIGCSWIKMRDYVFMTMLSDVEQEMVVTFACNSLRDK